MPHAVALPACVRLLPPIRRGDLPALSTDPTDLVVVIDGEFGQSLAVSVAEVRAVLAQGVQVWGAASMGALRAAECWPLGMRGIGWVYGAYRSGRLGSDDEVALMYDPTSKRACTLPLVNLRWLLGLAVSKRVIERAAAEHALNVLMEIPYQDRSWRSSFKAIADECGVQTRVSFERFVSSLPTNRRDRKSLDAETALRLIETQLGHSK